MLPLRDLNPRRTTPYVTWLIFIANVLVFLYQVYLGEGRAGFEFVMRNAFIPERFTAAPLQELPTLLSSAFMHGGLLHLLGNMIFLLVFADNVEDRLGKFGFALFYLAGAASATLLHALFDLRSSVPLVGASGAISAVLGAYMVYYPRQRVLTFIAPLFLPWLALSFFLPLRRFFLLWLPAWVYIGYWAAVQLFEATLGAANAPMELEQQVAWWAHVGGFAFGTLAAVMRRGARTRAP